MIEDKEKRYTWRHRCALDDTYRVYARSKKEALDFAIFRFENGDIPDQSATIRDTWTLVEEKDD